MEKQQELELKAQLESTLQRQIALADWRAIKSFKCLKDYESDLDDELVENEAWTNLVESVKDLLALLSERDDNKRREQAGTLPEQGENSEVASYALPNEPSVDLIPGFPDKPSSARGSALDAYNRIRAGSEATYTKPQSGATFFPRGGTDGTLPQWVILIQAEAWIPAEDVKSLYQFVQADLSEEKEVPPKTHARTFKVVEFVWGRDWYEGRRIPWSELLELWHERYPEYESFKSWRAFRKCFKQGEEAVPPHYARSEQKLQDWIERGTNVAAFDAWASRFRETL